MILAMQAFKPEAFAKIFVFSTGKPNRLSSGLIICDNKKLNLFELSKYWGTSNPAEVASEVLMESLGLLQKLRFEKIAIVANFSLELLHNPKSRRLPKDREIRALWDTFRLKIASETEDPDAQSLAFSVHPLKKHK